MAKFKKNLSAALLFSRNECVLFSHIKLWFTDMRHLCQLSPFESNWNILQTEENSEEEAGAVRSHGTSFVLVFPSLLLPVTVNTCCHYAAWQKQDQQQLPSTGRRSLSWYAGHEATKLKPCTTSRSSSDKTPEMLSQNNLHLNDNKRLRALHTDSKSQLTPPNRCAPGTRQKYLTGHLVKLADMKLEFFIPCESHFILLFCWGFFYAKSQQALHISHRGLVRLFI